MYKSNKFLTQIKRIISVTVYKCNNMFGMKNNLFDLNKYLFGPKIFSLNETNVI